MSQVEKLLTQASECLPDDMQIDSEATGVSTNDFHEFMKHHEWGLAMETLEEIAINMNPMPPSTFWALLVHAARIMNSHNNLIRYQSYVDQHKRTYTTERMVEEPFTIALIGKLATNPKNRYQLHRSMWDFCPDKTHEEYSLYLQESISELKKRAM